MYQHLPCIYEMAMSSAVHGYGRVAPAKQAAWFLPALLIVGVMVWQGVTAHGAPDPTVKRLSPTAMILSTGILVFREGLEAILVLAAVTAGMARANRKEYLRAVPFGALAAFLASIATWFLAVAIISHVNAPEYAVQAGTGLLAIVVLLVVMNWFFHKVYWTGWIANHNDLRRKLLENASTPAARTFFGFALLGFTAIYREGFEVVLFLQYLRMTAGNALVLEGTTIGLWLSVFPNAQSLLAQALAALLVIGSYFSAQHLRQGRSHPPPIKD